MRQVLVRTLRLSTGCLVLAAAIGCAPGTLSAHRGDKLGRTYYIDGAGNWGYGVAEVQAGLRLAGYRGAIINYLWSPTFNPALDQTIGRPFAKAKGVELANEIQRYLRKFPENEINIIALSAGTGVAVWACESLKPPVRVHNLILLGSSLSADYDVSTALQHMDGVIYVYYSGSDLVLNGPVRTLGTIDGKLGAASAGLIGLRPARGDRSRIVNIGWSSKYEQYGWTGSHTDATSTPFVRYVLAKHILSNQTLAKSPDGQEAPDQGAAPAQPIGG